MTLVIVPLLGWADRPVRALLIDDAADSAHIVLAPEDPPIPLRLDDNGGPSSETSFLDRAVAVACANTTDLRAASERHATADTFVEALELADVLLAPDGTVPRTDLDPLERRLLDNVQRELRSISGRVGAVGRVPLEEVLGAVAEAQSQVDRAAGQVRELGRRPLRPRSGDQPAPSAQATALTPIHLLALRASAVLHLHARDVYTLGELLSASEEVAELDASSRRKLREAAQGADLEVPGWLVEADQSAPAEQVAPAPSGRSGDKVSGHSDIPLADAAGIPSGAVRALEAAGHRTLGQLTRLTPKQLGKIKGIGPKWTAAIARVLEGRGLALAAEKSRRRGETQPTTKPVAAGDQVPGVGVVTKIHTDGYGFLQSATGEDLYMPPKELRSLVRDLHVGDTIAYRGIKPGTRRREAVGLKRATPDVVGMTSREARDLLERQRLRVEEETGGRRIWVESNWRVTLQRPGAGSPIPRDAVVTVHLRTSGSRS